MVWHKVDEHTVKNEPDSTLGNIGQFLDKYVEKKNDIVKGMTPCKKPLILLLDNINMYQGSNKYHRLFRVFGPKMWNFTGRGVIVPDISGIEHLFKDSETAVESQSDLLKLDINDALIDNNTEHHSLWDLWINYYLLDILSVAFPFVPSDLELSKLSENEFNTWLSKVKFEEIDTSSCKIDSSNLLVKFRKTYSGSHSATKTAILNLSLENNATVTGTGAILQELANQFDIPASEKQEYLPYDASTKTFAIKHARNHIEFLRMMNDQEHEMANYEKSLYETEKRLAGLGQGLSDTEFAEGVHWDAEEGGDLLDEENETALEDVHLDEELEFDIDDYENLEKAVPCATLAEKKKKFKREDEIFSTTYARLLNKMWKFHQPDCLDEFILHLCNRKDTYSVTDHLGRTITHVAVEQNHELLLECILAAGYNPNIKEHCGATPLTLAVIKKSTKLVKLLLSAGANVIGPLYAEIPTPLEMARKLELAEIYELMNPVDSDDDDECLLYYDEKLSTTVVVEQQQESSSNETSFDRSTPGFLTGVVGDCGTCKSNRGAMERSSCLNWMGIIPGDLHMKGSLSECCYKEHGVGGPLYITRNVMKRPGLKEEVFKEKKYDHDNLRKIKEAVKDCARSYGLAAALEFGKSPFFPNPGSLRSCFRKNGKHNMVMYASFRAFIEHASTENASFKYRGRMFLHYGPLLELFDFATHYNAGLARETCYILQLPSYAHLNFRNYYTETFIHVLNFISKWPLAFRKLVQQNSSVNIHGMKGAGIEHDAWVESRIVKATKNATSGHATVTTCRRLAGAIDIVRSVRECYLGRDAFDDHTTKRHSAPSSIPDQLKGAWFSLSKGLICSLKSDSLPRVVTSSDTDDNPATVPKFLLHVHAKGVAKMSANFTKKIYDSFPDTRFQILNNN